MSVACPVDGCRDPYLCRHPSDPRCAGAQSTIKDSFARIQGRIDVEEVVDHPSHYGGKNNPYEAIKVIAAWRLGFLIGNCVKYLARAGKKDPAKLLEDFRKARWYLDDAISRLERGEGLF